MKMLTHLQTYAAIVPYFAAQISQLLTNLFMIRTFTFLLFLSHFFTGNVFAQNVRTWDITQFGAKGDSSTLCTKSIQQAIDAAHMAGGGRVIVPPGRYSSGTIFLKSYVTLEVMAGGKIIGSPNISDYTPMTMGHNKDRQPYHLIIAIDAQDFSIEGGGIIDGNGPAFWQPFNPADLPLWIMAKDKKVSPMVEIQRCKNFRLKDVTLLTGGGWTLHLYDSDHGQVQGVKILNNLFSPNGDGIDISGCFDITISDCIIKTCDDAICLKTMGDSRECKRVTVTNCIIECSCAALKIGNESFRDISQVTFSNCVIYNSNRAIGLYAEGAGHISDVAISNIVCDTKAPFLFNRPIHISLLQRVSPEGGIYGGEIEATNKYFDHEGRVAQMRNISISNFISKTDGRILITAEPGKMIENLTLRDIHLDYPAVQDPLLYVEQNKSAQFSPFNPDAKKAAAALVVENVKNLVVDNFSISWPNKNAKVPADWQAPKRIANGTLDFFYLKYDKTIPRDMNAIWMRNVQGGYVFAPLAASTDKKLPNFDIKNSTIKVISTK